MTKINRQNRKIYVFSRRQNMYTDYYDGKENMHAGVEYRPRIRPGHVDEAAKPESNQQSILTLSSL